MMTVRQVEKKSIWIFGRWKGSVNNLISFDSFLLTLVKKDFMLCKNPAGCSRMEAWGAAPRGPETPRSGTCWLFHILASLFSFLRKENKGSKDRESIPSWASPGESLCLHSLKPQLPHWRQCPNAGPMMECCFYSSDMSMLVPQSKIFMQQGLFAAFLWKEHRTYCFKGQLTKAVKGIIPTLNQSLHFRRGKHMHLYVLRASTKGLF